MTATADAAPRALTRQITLNQTVDLVSTTIDTVASARWKISSFAFSLAVSP